MSADITGLVAELRGQEFIDALRRIHAGARERGGFVRCAGEGCTNPAVWLGMQRCGAPGGPACELHWQRQQEWMAAAAAMGQPWCRHCRHDVDASHVYVVALESEAAK